ncbi:MAG: hypothetical protein MJD61_18370 [Proteobacteria bacterium]|nr:hypothetical protein [Pseudomonadota bacterium]
MYRRRDGSQLPQSNDAEAFPSRARWAAGTTIIAGLALGCSSDNLRWQGYTDPPGPVVASAPPWGGWSGTLGGASGRSSTGFPGWPGGFSGWPGGFSGQPGGFFSGSGGSSGQPGGFSGWPGGLSGTFGGFSGGRAGWSGTAGGFSGTPGGSSGGPGGLAGWGGGFPGGTAGVSLPPGGPPPTQGQFCAGHGPPILITDTPAGQVPVCGGAIAQTTFRWALCTCEDHDAADRLVVDAFNSNLGPYVPGGPGGSVGTNGSYTATYGTTIGGSLWIGGSGRSSVTDTQTVAGDLYVAGPFDASANVSVGRNAVFAGSVRGDRMRVSGFVAIAPNLSLDVSSPAFAGGVVRAPTVVFPPCACAPQLLVDIAGFVRAHRGVNDNASINLDPAAFARFSGERVLNLPCGRYYLNGVDGTGRLAIRAQGRVALFVGGDLRMTDELSLQLDPGAEVDVFVAGTVQSTSRLFLGSQLTPAKVRLYVGGYDAITLTGTATVAGNFYAPHAELILTDRLDVYGALFVRRITFTQELRIHYDQAILTAGQPCPAPPPGCRGCWDCGNQACINGACAPCTHDSQCCSPLVCASNGVCVPPVH